MADSYSEALKRLRQKYVQGAGGQPAPSVSPSVPSTGEDDLYAAARQRLSSRYAVAQPVTPAVQPVTPVVQPTTTHEPIPDATAGTAYKPVQPPTPVRTAPESVYTPPEPIPMPTIPEATAGKGYNPAYEPIPMPEATVGTGYNPKEPATLPSIPKDAQKDLSYYGAGYSMENMAKAGVQQAQRMEITPEQRLEKQVTAVAEQEFNRVKRLGEFKAKPMWYATAILEGRVLPAEIGDEAMPFQELYDVSKHEASIYKDFRPIAELGLKDPVAGKKALLDYMQNRETTGYDVMRSIKSAGSDILTFGAQQVDVPPQTKAGEVASFVTQVAGQIPLVYAAGATIPNAVTNPLIRGAITGGELAAARELVGAAARPEEADLKKSLMNIATNAAEYGAYMGVYSKLTPAVDGLISKSPRLAKVLETIPGEVAKGAATGAVAGGTVGIGKATLDALAAEGFDVREMARKIGEESKQELSEEVVEAIALGIVQKLTGARVQSANVEGITAAPKANAADTMPKETGPVTVPAGTADNQTRKLRESPGAWPTKQDTPVRSFDDTKFPYEPGTYNQVSAPEKGAQVPPVKIAQGNTIPDQMQEPAPRQTVESPAQTMAPVTADSERVELVKAAVPNMSDEEVLRVVQAASGTSDADFDTILNGPAGWAPQGQSKTVTAQQPPTIDRAQILRDANPGMDERAIQDMVTTTADISNEEFAGFSQRAGTPEEAPETKATNLTTYGFTSEDEARSVLQSAQGWPDAGEAVREYISPRQRKLTPEEIATRETAYALRDGKPEAVEVAAKEMAVKVPPNAILVPIPSSQGDTAANEALATRIAELSGAQVRNALTRSEPAESVREKRLRGEPGPTPEYHKFEATEDMGAETSPFIFIDNVMTTGATFRAAQDALGGKGQGLAFARSTDFVSEERAARLPEDVRGRLTPDVRPTQTNTKAAAESGRSSSTPVTEAEPVEPSPITEPTPAAATLRSDEDARTELERLKAVQNKTPDDWKNVGLLSHRLKGVTANVSQDGYTITFSGPISPSLGRPLAAAGYRYNGETKAWTLRDSTGANKVSQALAAEIRREMGPEGAQNTTEPPVVAQQVTGAQTPAQTQKTPAQPSQDVETAKRKRLAQSLRATADNMQKQIDAKRNPPVASQNPTARRANIIAGMAKEADAMEQVQTILRNLADAHEAGTVPDSLKEVRTKAMVETLLQWDKLPLANGWAKDTRKRLMDAGYKTDRAVHVAHSDLVALLSRSQASPEEQAEKKRQAGIKAAERNLIGRKIDGYFPTPRATVDRLLEATEIEPGMSVLEPSAGKGNIADVIKETAPDALLEAIEPVQDLRTILEAKGHKLVGRDFLEHTGSYDRIVMNPPFENYQDVTHVQHAYDLLKPGGRLVSIMSEGPFFRGDKKGVAFREWLDEVGGTSEKLPDGSFKSSERQTGVATRMVVIDKPAEEHPTTQQSAAASEAKPTKEPHAMTLAEYRQGVLDGAVNFKLLGNQNRTSADLAHDLRNAQRTGHNTELVQKHFDKVTADHHRADVTMAIAKGRTVPESVLKEYTDLHEAAKRKDRMTPTSTSGDLTPAEAKVAIATGSTVTAKTERGTSIEAQYAIVDAGQLISSHDTALKQDERYPQELQPRDRSRLASEDQVNRIANGLEPSFLGESPKVSEGAPIVGPDMVVESGNGRVIALKRIYEQNHKNAATYRQWLVDNAAKFGLDPKVIEDAGAPVLVRVRKTEVDRAEFARQANEQAVAAMSAAEQAKADATKLDTGMMFWFDPSDSGEIVHPGNRDFVRRFLEKVIGPNERGNYLTSDGKLSQSGITRIRNAVFAKAYGDTGAIEKLAESPDNNVRSITNGMLQAAGRIAQVNDGIAEGRLFDVDLSQDIAAAMSKLSALREQGTTVEEYLRPKQLAFFRDDLPDMARDILEVFDKNKRSPRKIATILSAYAEMVEVAGDPRQQTLFARIQPTKAEIWEAAVQRAEANPNGVQVSLFQDQTGSSQSPAGSSTEAGQPTQGGQGEGSLNQNAPADGRGVSHSNENPTDFSAGVNPLKVLGLTKHTPTPTTPEMEAADKAIKWNDQKTFADKYGTPKEAMRTVGNAVIDQWFDRDASLKRLKKAIAGNQELTADMDAYLRIQILPKLQAGYTQTYVDKMGEVLEPAGKRIRDYFRYADAVETLFRAKTFGYTWNDKTLPMKESVAQAIVDRVENGPDAQAFRQIWDQEQALWNELRGSLIKSGVMTQEAIDQMMGTYAEKDAEGNVVRQMYVPFFRDMTAKADAEGRPLDADGPTPGVMGLASKPGNVPKAILTQHGSNRPLMDPYERRMRAIARMVGVGQRNDVYLALDKFLETFDPQGTIAPRVAPPMERVTGALQEDDPNIPGMKRDTSIMRQLEDLGFDANDLADPNGVINFFKPTYVKQGDTLVTYFKDGKRVYRDFKRIPDVLETLTGLEPVAQNVVSKAFSWANQTYKTGATITPGFTVANLIRDTAESYILSHNQVIPGHALWEALRLISSKDPFVQRVVGAGLKQGGWLRPESLSRDLVRKLEDPQGATLNWRTLWEFYQNVREQPELWTRLGEASLEYKAQRGKGADDMDAFLKAMYEGGRITLNFTRAGRTSRIVNKYVPFFKIPLEAGYRLGERVSEESRKAYDPRSFWFKAVVPSMALATAVALIGGDDEQYREASDSERDKYILIPIGKGLLRIPKPNGVYGVFFNLAERSMNQWMHDDPAAFHDFGRNAIQEMFPRVGNPALELAVVLTTWFQGNPISFDEGRPILTTTEQKRSPELQYDRYTSPLVKSIVGGLGVSPKVVQHLIDKFFPGYSQGLFAAEKWAKKIKGEEAVRPEDVVGRFYTRPGEGKQGRSVTLFYERVDRADRLYNDMKRRIEEESGRSVDPQKLTATQVSIRNRLLGEMSAEDRKIYGQRKELGKVSDQMSAIRKQIDRINADEKLPPQQKQKEIERLTKIITERAQSALK